MAPAIIAAVITAGVSAAVAGVELTNQPTPPKAPTQVQQTTQQGATQQAAAIAQAEALTKRRGMASTILTSPTGTNSGPANAQTATLGT